MPTRQESSLLRFAEKTIVLLDQGGFAATYKYAVLLGLMDLCFERGTRHGGVPSMVTTAQLAEKVVALYWPQTRAFQTPASQAGVLRQNARGQAEIVSLLVEFRRRHAPDPSATLFRAKLAAPEQFERLVREVEWKLVEMPLPKLQRVGRGVDEFIYTIGWNDHVRKRDFNSDEFDNRILFRPGAAESLLQLTGVLRPLVHRHWVARVTRLNDLPESGLETFLFGADRSAMQPVRAPLLELQDGRCFYCEGRISTGGEVDHFLPWARVPDDGIDNLVVAHDRCNRHKSDFLADAGHVESWARRVVRGATSLEQIAVTARWPRDGRRTVSVLSAIYGGLPDDVRVWHLEKDFVPFDRSRGEAAFQSLREAPV